MGKANDANALLFCPTAVVTPQGDANDSAQVGGASRGCGVPWLREGRPRTTSARAPAGRGGGAPPAEAGGTAPPCPSA
eukprot:2689205-Pyramimonas_sp.AAC.1